MPTSRSLPRFLAAAGLAAAAVVVGCSDSNGPDDGNVRPPNQFRYIEVADDAPPLFNATVTFWAYTDRDAEARIYFQDPGTGGQGQEYARLRVRQGSLRAAPDGTPFAPGDSVQITMTVVDPDRFLVELEPAGLAFDASEPAELKFEYDHADHDFDRDGDVDAIDATLELRIAVWRQESPGDPFTKLSSVLLEVSNEVEAELTGFSRYAISY